MTNDRYRFLLLTLSITVILLLGGCQSAQKVEDAVPGDLVITGTKQIAESSLRSALKKEIADVYQRGFKKAGIDDLSFEIERHYRNSGYHFARCEYTYAETSGDTAARGAITVKEGPRVELSEIRFAGNATLSDATLRKLLRERRTGLFSLGTRLFVARDVSGLPGSVADVYAERGYLEVEIEKPETTFSPDRTEAVITVTIKEGRPFIIEAIDLSKTPAPDRERLNERFAAFQGQAYIPYRRFAVRTGVEEYFGARGYPKPDVEVRTRFSEQPDRVNVTITATAVPGSRVRIRRILVENNNSIGDDFIRSRLEIRSGDRYNAEKINKSHERLFGTGLFKSVRITLQDPPKEADEEKTEPPAEPAKPPPRSPATPPPGPVLEPLDLVVEVEERPTLEYFFEIGYGSYDLLRGKAGVRERNVLGTGIGGRAEVVGSIRGVQLTVGAHLPWFLHSAWNMDVPITWLFREEPSYTIQQTKIRIRMDRPLSENVTVGGLYRFELSKLDDVTVEDTTATDEDLVLGAIGPFIEYNTWDNAIEPTRGTRSRLFAEVGSPILGGEITFAHWGLNLSQYAQPYDGLVLAMRFHTEWIEPLGSTGVIPIQERLFSGGENTVRSFKLWQLGPKDQNGEALGGEVRNIISIEARQRLIGHLSLAVFGDYGNIAESVDDAFEDFRPAVGVGLRYALPIGPVRVDVGFNPDKRSDERLYVIHIVVGMPY